MEQDEYRKIIEIAEFVSNWWYKKIRNSNIIRIRNNNYNDYIKIRKTNEYYQINKHNIKKYEKLKEEIRLNTIKELSLNGSLFLETKETPIGKLKTYFDKLELDCNVPADINMYINERGVILKNGIGKNKKIIFSPKEDFKVLQMR